MLSDAKYLCVRDATSGYWQTKLDEESSLLTHFNTPFGRYHFTRMHFGIHSFFGIRGVPEDHGHGI